MTTFENEFDDSLKEMFTEEEWEKITSYHFSKEDFQTEESKKEETQ